MSQATEDIERRRREQDRQHGGPGQDDRRRPEEWVVLLGKYLGRAAEGTPLLGKHPKAYRDALVDLAAVAQAAVESHDRKEGTGR